MRVSSSIIFLLLVFGMLIAGCTQPQQPQTQSVPQAIATPLGTESPAVVPGESTSTPGIDQYPAPPVDNAVSAQINDKDQVDKTIHVFFSGGKGQKMVRDSWVIMQRSDGSIERVSLPPRAQSEIVLQGTDGSDLVRVYAEYYDGNVYQIAEKTLRLRQRV